MKTFREYLVLEADPTGGLGGLAAPATMPGGAGMGGGPPMGGPPMGGGMAPPMGGPMGMDPMGGGGAMGGQQAQMELKPSSVWDVMEKILKGKHIEDDKKTGNDDKNMVQQQPQQSQPPQQPSPTGQPDQSGQNQFLMGTPSF